MRRPPIGHTTRSPLLLLFFAAFFELICVGSQALGQTTTTLYWDTTAAIAATGSAGGDWNNSAFWTSSSTGGITTGSWSGLSGTSNNVYFSAGSSGTGAFGVTVQGVAAGTGVNKLIIEEGTVSLNGATSARVLTLTGDGEIQVASGLTLFLAVDIAGSVGLTKTGSGTLNKSSTDAYTGTTWIKEGVFQAGNNVIPDASAVRIDAGATPQLQHRWGPCRRSRFAGRRWYAAVERPVGSCLLFSWRRQHEHHLFWRDRFRQ